MKTIDIHSNQSKSLILFFNGWGFDEAYITHLQTQTHDVKMIYDYRTLNPIPATLFSGYSSVTIVAWSFGVWVANHVLCGVASSVSNAFAINGTIHPVNDLDGIPQHIFAGTLNSLTENSYHKFQERLMGGSKYLKQNSTYLPKRLFAEQKQELECLAQHFNEPDNGGLRWNKAMCGTLDRIFPFENQKRFWGDKAIEKPYPHFVFDHYLTWDDVLNDFDHD